MVSGRIETMLLIKLLAMSKDITKGDSISKVYKKRLCSEKKPLTTPKFTHLYTTKNPGYWGSLRYLFIDHKLHAKMPLKALEIRDFDEKFVSVSTVPKYYSWYVKHEISEDTGELLSEVCESDSERKKRGKKISKFKAFDSVYLPLYRQKKVSLMFVTLTMANEASNTITGLMKALKQRAIRNDSELLGYVWVSEVSLKYGIHWHYHFVMALPRLEVRTLPQWLKLETVWGKITKAGFVTMGGKLPGAYGYYLSKYLSKETGTVCNVRSYGSSMKFNTPGKR